MIRGISAGATRSYAGLAFAVFAWLIVTFLGLPLWQALILMVVIVCGVELQVRARIKEHEDERERR